MQIGRDAAFDNPLFYLACYGVRGTSFAWLVAHGGLIDLEEREVNVADFGDRASLHVARQAFPGLRIGTDAVLR